MKKKLVAFCLVGLFLLTSFSSLSFAKKESTLSKTIQGSDDIQIENNANNNHPDLIIEFEYYMPRPGSYRYKQIITNIGDDIAIIPKGYTIYHWHGKTIYGTVHDLWYNDSEDFILIPGESVIYDYAGDPAILAFGSIMTVTVDPNNVVYESEEGENNNVDVVRIIKGGDSSIYKNRILTIFYLLKQIVNKFKK